MLVHAWDVYMCMYRNTHEHYAMSSIKCLSAMTHLLGLYTEDYNE